jgi:hypothetical protein
MRAKTKFYLDQLEKLVGATIVGTCIEGSEEGDFFGITIKLPGGKIKHLILLSDDEGNGPGSFELVDQRPVVTPNAFPSATQRGS